MGTFISRSAEETAALGEAWAKEARPGWVIGLSGELGAGKTQLARGLARGLGSTARVHSPTFALVHEYGGGRLPLFHLDLYRLGGRDEIIAAGLEIYLTAPNGVVVVEWMERCGQASAHDYRAARILLRGENEREIQYEDFLALEFSSTRRSAAVVDAQGGLLGAVSQDGGRAAIAVVEEALARAGAEREGIEILAVGLGPGSYTGIRGAVALAQGWQIGLPVKTLGVSSAECLAAEAQRAGILGAVNIVVDAQRNEFYLARYDLEVEARRVIEPLRLASAAEIAELAGRGKLVGPEIAARFPDAMDLYPDAATLGRLASEHTDFISAERLEPIYLRETTFAKAPPPRVIPGRS